MTASATHPKMLIIKISALGDLFMALPHMDVIIEQDRAAEVWVLTGPAFEHLFAHHPRINTAVLDRDRRLGRNSLWGRILWVRRQRFSAVYDLQGNRISRLIVRFSGAVRRVGTQPLTIYTHHPETPYTRETRQNVFDRLNETLAAAGLPHATPGCRLHPGKQDRDAVMTWRQKNGIHNGRYALIHAGSSRSWPSKRWPKESFLKLATRIATAGVHCIWTGAAEDRNVNDELSRHVGIDATERFTILQLYLLAKDALFAVANDSGPMHIFAASGIPVFSFFGPTSWLRSHAAGQATRVFSRAVDCSPCFWGTCPPDRHHICLRTIDPDDVFSTIQRHIDFESGGLS